MSALEDFYAMLEQDNEPKVWDSYMQEWYNFTTQFLDNWGIKSLIATGVTGFAEIFGADAKLVGLLCVMLLLDLVLGLIVAIKSDKQLSGRRLHGGMVKFGVYAFTLLLVLALQDALGASFHINIPLLGIYSAYQCLTEISSVTRHLTRLGITLPKLFVRILDASSHNVDKKIDEVLRDKENYDERDNRDNPTL